MKLRLKHNSIRLRLTQGEVTQLAASGSVEESIEFGAGRRLTYRLIGTDDESTTASFGDGGTLSVAIPRTTASEWALGDEVGLNAEIDADGSRLSVLIEKDFTCLKKRDDGSDEDTFPHPDAARAT